MDGPHVVLLGAGHGRRMGGPKVLTRHGGRTFLERILARCAESASPVTLTVDPRFRAEVEALLETCAPPKPTLADQPGKFGLGSGVCVARALDPSPDPDYPAPGHFTGGEIEAVVVDVSGDEFVDHDLEVQSWLARD